MAKHVQTIVTLSDDVDGTNDDTVETRHFRIDKEMELTDGNYTRIQAILDGALAKARDVINGGRSGSRRVGIRVDQKQRDRNRRIRAWAKANDHPTSDRGRPRKIVERAYVAATGDAG